MLRRKLIARLGPLVLAFVAATVIAVMMLQSVLRDLAHLTLDTAAMVDGVYELGSTVSGIRARLVRGDTDLEAEVARAEGLFQQLRASTLVQGIDAPAAEEYRLVGELLPGFLAAAAQGQAAAGGDDRLDEAINTLAGVARQHIIEERTRVRARLRHVVVGITIMALLMLNAAVLLLLHTARLVLRPVDELIEASRQLGQERFDYRVKVKQFDEFDQLAEAYNRLAGQLAANEERKMETLRQAAVALNHDLNNVLGIITLQLTKMGRQSEDNPALRQQLQLVQGNLSRMAETIQSLHRLRRIVLTEYMPGQQMLDLSKSLEPDGPELPQRDGGRP